MLGKSIRIGSIMGIPLLVTPTWFLLAAATTWILAAQLFPGPA